MSEQTYTGTTDADGYLPISWAGPDPLIAAHEPVSSIAAQDYDSASGQYTRVRFLSSDGLPLGDLAVSATIRDAAAPTAPELEESHDE